MGGKAKGVVALAAIVIIVGVALVGAGESIAKSREASGKTSLIQLETEPTVTQYEVSTESFSDLKALIEKIKKGFSDEK